MSQKVSMSVRAETIKCTLAENPKEKEYNYSLKMIGYAHDSHSEHSSNLKNPLFKSSALHDLKDDLPENYHMKDLDEGKRMKVGYFTSNQKYFRQSSGNDGMEVSKSVRSEEPRISESKGSFKGPVNQVHLTNETSKLLPEEEESPLRKRKKTLVPEFNSEDPTPNSPGHKDKAEIKDGKRELRWPILNHEKAPLLETEIFASDIATNSMQFFLWSIKNPEGQAKKDAIYIDHKLVGECYISLNKIYSDINNLENKDTEVPKESNFTVTRRAKISEKLWNHGVYIGMLEGELLIECNPFYRQMLCGVYTDIGIQKSTTVVMKKQIKTIFDLFKNTLNKEMKLLNQFKDQLVENVFKLSDNKVQFKNQGRIIDDLAGSLVKILEILKTSHKESMTSFIYRSSEDLLTSQKVLIDLSKHLVEYCDQVPLTLRPLYYECLTQTILRGELELNFMGFDVETYDTLMENASKTSFKNQGIVKGTVDVKNVKQKMKVATSYQTFLYQTLDKVLKILNHKGLIDKERDFVETFCAVAYFRIPEFREKLLNCFDDASDEGIKVTEWRGTDWLLDGETDDRRKNQQIISLFDWDKVFYYYLKTTPKGEQNAELLANMLNDEKWQKRFSKRGIAFYFFLNEWTKHVNKTVVIKDHVPWQDLPGYNVLIKNFLIELKKRDVKQLPEALIDTSVTLLKNEKLLNIFIAIIYNKTRVYDSSNVFAVFELVNTWLQALTTYQKKIPSTFDYNFFFKGLFMVIEGDHSLNIAKVLWVLYNNISLITQADRKQTLCDFLLGSQFFRLFLHWSFNVRQVFHHLLIFRMFHQHRSSNSNLKRVEDLKMELHLYNQKRDTYNKSQRNLLINEYISMEYSRYITIIENARKKIIDESHKEAVAARLKQKSSKYQKLKLQSSGNLLATTTTAHQLRRNSFSSSPLKGAYGTHQQDKVDNPGSNYFLLNSDKLDTSVNFGAQTKPLDDGFNPLMSDVPDKQAASSKAETFPRNEINMQTRKSSDLLQSQLNGQLSSEGSSGRVVIHRKFAYYDKTAQKYNEIPKELMVYLMRAYDEFEEIKKSYLRWLQEVEAELSGKSEEERKKILANPPVPELLVKIPLDEGESSAIQPEDW